MEEKLKTKVYIKVSDTTLHCRPVGGSILQTIMSQMASIDGMNLNEPETLTTLMGADQAKALAASERLFNYCAGWGVIEDPPPGRTEITDLMMIDMSQPNLRKAAWVRYELGASEKELGDVIGIVMGLTFAGPQLNGQEAEVGADEEE